MTDILISRLAADLRPVSPHAVAQRLFVGMTLGATVSVVLLVFAFGLRPDLTEAMSTAVFWLKVIYTVALAALGCWLGDRLVRPAGEASYRIAWLVPPIAIVALASARQLGQASSQEQHQLIFGASASLCPWYIVLFSLAPLAGLVWAVRGLAPTKLSLAGAAMGLAAGGTGACIYALHCTEAGAPFVGLWYSSGIAVVTVVGGLIGPRVLHW